MDTEELILMRANETRVEPPARCGFCGMIVDGDTTAMAPPSEQPSAHRDSFVFGLPANYDEDVEVFCCDGECPK